MGRSPFNTAFSAGERSFNFESLLDTESDVKTSIYHFLVWKSNMGLMDHPIFKHLTEAKWELYGEQPTKKSFWFLGVYSLWWTGLYMLQESYIYTHEPGEDDETREEESLELKYVHMIHLVVYIGAFIGYLHRLKTNCMRMYQRYKYFLFIKDLISSINDNESAYIHPKGKHLIDDTSNQAQDKKMTFFNDIRRAPSLVIDMVVDNMLAMYFFIKIWSMLNQNVKNIESIIGAIVIIFLWTNTFLKLQITKKIGPFVIFMKYVPRDLGTVTTMFITLFAPAFLVFYKTIFVKKGRQLEENEALEDAADEVLNRSRRAAAKGGGGSGGNGGPMDLLGSFFAVLRMVLVDYEYEDGLARSDPPLWWMTMSLVWIIVSSVIVLNLMIAVMADSYSRIYERSEISSRFHRAQTICDIEKRMNSKELGQVVDKMVEMSPIRILFDPVCDRDKMEIVAAKVNLLSNKMARLEGTIHNRLFMNLKRRLDFIEAKANIQSFKPTTGAPFFTYK